MSEHSKHTHTHTHTGYTCIWAFIRCSVLVQSRFLFPFPLHQVFILTSQISMNLTKRLIDSRLLCNPFLYPRTPWTSTDNKHFWEFPNFPPTLLQFLIFPPISCTSVHNLWNSTEFWTRLNHKIWRWGSGLHFTLMLDMLWLSCASQAPANVFFPSGSP